MPTYDRDFQLGLLPEKKWDWRTFAASYGILTGLILFLIVFGILMPETLLSNDELSRHGVDAAAGVEAGAAAQSEAAAGACEVAAGGAGFRDAETDRAARSARAQAAAAGN